MRKIRIVNFGPIKDGFRENDGFMDIRKVTVFIGNQGSGKSSVAKLISTMTWLEKALIRGDFNENDLKKYNRFVNKHCAYQNIDNYFKNDTEIEYVGSAYTFVYSNNKLDITNNKEPDIFSKDSPKYIVPQIMYVPAERNFVSAVDNPSALKKLPPALYTFLDEFENAKREIKESLDLPVNRVKFEYHRLNKMSYITGEDYKIRLSESSSGFQSLVPLYLVTKYLAESINKHGDATKKELSIEDKNTLKQKIAEVLKNRNFSDELLEVALEVLLSRFKNSCFINIVEEPEQNLYPTSQKGILYKLIEYANMNEGNRLIITTHSPYIINYLTLAIQAKEVLPKIKQSPNYDKLKIRLSEIVPEASCIDIKESVIYELDELGKIKTLPSIYGIPSDENYLNALLAKTNELFDDLLEIEENL